MTLRHGHLLTLAAGLLALASALPAAVNSTGEGVRPPGYGGTPGPAPRASGLDAAPAGSRPPAPEAPPPPETLHPPALQVLRCRDDVKRVSPEGARRNVRYLDLAAVPPERRADFARALAGDQNLGSRAAVVYPVAAVPGSGLTLLRLDLGLTGVDPAVHDKLLAADVVYHAVVSESYEYPDPSNAYAAHYRTHQGERQYRAADGNYYRVGTYHRTAVKDSPDLRLDDATRTALADLQAETGSDLPVVRAEVYLRNFAVAEGVVPGTGYYERLGVKSVEDWFRLVGARWGDFGNAVRAAAAVSGVTQRPRGYVALPGKYGKVWLSLDSNLALGGQDFLSLQGRQLDLRNVAVEGIGLLANGMQAYVAFTVDGQGKLKLQAKAPDDVAACPRNARNDARVLVGVRCAQCHRQGGLNDIDCWWRGLYGGERLPPGALALDRAFREEYLVPLAQVMDPDRQKYEHAVKQATGAWAVADWADGYAAAYDWGDALLVDAAQAQRDMGIPIDHLRQSLERFKAPRKGKAGGQSPVLEAVLLHGKSVPARQWEAQRQALLDIYLENPP